MLNLGVEVDLETSTLSSYHIAALQKERLNSGPPKYKDSKDALVTNIQRGIWMDVWVSKKEIINQGPLKGGKK